MTDHKDRYVSIVTTIICAACVSLLVVQLALNWVTICGSSTYSLVMAVLSVAVSLVATSALPVWTSPRSVCLSGLLLIAASAVSANVIDRTLTLSSGWANVSVALGFALPAVFVILPLMAALLWSQAIGLRCRATFSDRPLRLQSAEWLGLGCVSLVFLNSSFSFPASALPISFCVLGTVLTLRKQTKTSNVRTIDTDRTKGSAIDAIMAVSAGFLIHAAFRLFGSLFPTNILIAVTSAVLACGILAAVTLVPLKRTVVQVVAVCGLLCPIVFYRSFIETNLWINATVQQAWLSTVLRAVQPAAVLVLLWGICRATDRRFLAKPAGPSTLSEVRVFTSSSYRVFAFACCGVTLGLLGAIFGFSVKNEWVVGMGLLMGAVFLRIPSKEGQSRQVVIPVAMTGSLCVLLMLCSVPTAETSSLLFTGRSAIAFRDGMDLEVIRESDSHRLLEQDATSAGELTVWRTNGDQIEIRIDGFPTGQFSDNCSVSPAPIADTLATILPLVFHERPGAVMLMGDDVGVGIQICEQFPVPSVHAYSSSSKCADVASRHLLKKSPAQVNDDPRFEFDTLPVPLAIRQKAPDGGFDVVISTSPSPIVGQRLPEFNPQHYRHIRQQLSSDGVYCQRISQHDLGSEILMQMISTIREEFADAVIIQTVPGELIVLAACEEGTLLDKTLLFRLQKEHVKKQLAKSGLDWSQVASLPIVQTTGAYSVFKHLKQSASISCRPTSLAFALPLEASRWSDKSRELQWAFAPHQLRIADAVPRSKTYDEYARRFTSVIQEGEIAATFPDNPWPYRKSLKMEMQRNSRPPVEEFVNGQLTKSAHPADQYRKDYFVQLGKLLGQAKMGFVNPRDVRDFQVLLETYEPLLTWFAHQELIRIFEATGRLSPAQELRSRLYAINFAPVEDRGVHQIVAVLEQLIDQPQLFPETERRYDHANGLLQELVRRWELRRNHNPTSAARAQYDVDRCIRVARKTLEAMEGWAPEVKISHSRFAARRRFIHRSLVIPLRHYSDVVLAHRMENEIPSIAQPEWSPDESTLPGNNLPVLMDPSEAATN